MDVNSRKLLKLLKKKREDEDLSLRELAGIIGVSFSTLSRLEQKELKQEPDANTMARIATWLGKEAQDIGINYSEMALVHFRASKNIDSKTVEALLKVAELAKKQFEE